MNIKTSQADGMDTSKITGRIAKFWDAISPGMNIAWGPHIHHGFYDSSDNDEIIRPVEAQERLIDFLASHCGIHNKSRILDAGCGMGGSSIYLARKFGAAVHGITLSPVQARMAREAAASSGGIDVSFTVGDVLAMKDSPDDSYDLVWSLESCEQFYDKGLFLDKAWRILENDGTLMLATWCSGEEEYWGDRARRYRKLTSAFDLPSMPTMEHYRGELSRRKFRVITSMDISGNVSRSWDIGMRIAGDLSLFRILKTAGFRGLLFARQLKLMKDAYRTGMVRYGVFICKKEGE